MGIRQVGPIYGNLELRNSNRNKYAVIVYEFGRILLDYVKENSKGKYKTPCPELGSFRCSKSNLP